MTALFCGSDLATLGSSIENFNAASHSPRPSDELNDVPRAALTDFLWRRRGDGLPGGAAPLRADLSLGEFRRGGGGWRTHL